MFRDIFIIKTQPQRSTIAAQTIEAIDPSATQEGASPRKKICMKADPSRLIKKRSPLVVLMGKNPSFLVAVGLTTSIIVNRANPIATATKKLAVGKVQAIQFMTLFPV